MKLAAQLYTLREYTQTETDYYNTCVKVKNMGYSSVQLSGAGPMEAKTVKSISDELNLPVTATHIPHTMFVNELDKVIQNHKIMGCKYVGLGYMPKEYWESVSTLNEFITTYSKVAKALDKEGLRFVYHNHHFEFFKFKGKTMMDIILENTPSCFFFLPDTYWIQAAGANPVYWIKKLKGRGDYIHFKDMGIGSDYKTTFVPVGQGNLDWQSIIEACRYAEVKYIAVEQDTCEGSPFDALKASYDYLSSMGLK
ncbi:MAG TPA: sugar phosphate isomerase/epimerase [Clostridia bacterium]|jgi:sugar phosphate isomerase/epimerase|nr:sugar phosphate isomerase/epimerase [Clostridiaceae bacterium]HOF26681.1 sugar phosphate isomerase/epimerase [Clostridia bacterium]HOM35284.1 sugar phosphate isomerase/epimerase [Clostridia bacterium]HOR89807.1 sugar phosphate isomerase/epimerase [Clostridia bacterium]HOT71596.1 sugar phosphate isomerase/epimerase [Clostridia bacterium]